MNNNLLRSILNLVSVILALTVNILASSLPLNGQNTGEISDRFQVYFVPAGYVFAIWGLIYIGWLAFSIYQLLPANRSKPRLQSLGYWFALSGLLNAAWLFAWHYNQFNLSGLIMLGLLGTLIMSYLRLDVARSGSRGAEKWCIDVPFSIYLGWISVATIANISDILYLWNWDGFGISPLSWLVIMLAVAVILGGVVAATRGDIAYPLVFVWSFAGIAVKHVGIPTAQYSALIAAATCLGIALLVFLSQRNPKQTASIS